MRDWNDVLPPDVAEAQRWWDLYAQVRRMKELGLSREEVRRRRPETLPGEYVTVAVDYQSPVERWMARFSVELRLELLEQYRRMVRAEATRRLMEDPSAMRALVDMHRDSIDVLRERREDAYEIKSSRRMRSVSIGRVRNMVLAMIAEGLIDESRREAVEQLIREHLNV